MLAIENVALGHNMPQLKKFLCYLASHLGGQFTTQIEKQHMKINKLIDHPTFSLCRRFNIDLLNFGTIFFNQIQIFLFLHVNQLNFCFIL